MLKVGAGSLRGRSLKAPRGATIRPTSGKVRAAIFDMVGLSPECRVLDGFAGTGALGIEALSRGAGVATFVESGRASLRALRRNLADLDLSDRARVLPLRWADAVGRLPAAGFDLILLDPPYAQDPAPLFADLHLLLAPAGTFVLEVATRQSVLTPPEWQVRWRRYGDTSVCLGSRTS